MLEYKSNKKYYCTPSEKSSGFSCLQFLTINYYNIDNCIELMINDIGYNKKFNPNYINHVNDKGYNALMLACINYNNNSSIEIVKFLIENGAEINICDRNIYLLFKYCNEEIISFLVNKKLIEEDNIFLNYKNYENGEFVELGKYLFNYIKKIIYFIDNRKNIVINKVSNKLFNLDFYIYSLNKTGLEFLLLICKFSTSLIDSINFIIKCGFDVNYQDTNGNNLLSLVLLNYPKSFELIKLLVDNNSKIVNTKYFNKKFTIFIKDELNNFNFEYLKIFKYLVHLFDQNRKNEMLLYFAKNGENYKDISICCNFLKLLKILIKNGADINYEKYCVNILSYLVKYPITNKLIILIENLFKNGIKIKYYTIGYNLPDEMGNIIMDNIDMDKMDEIKILYSKFNNRLKTTLRLKILNNYNYTDLDKIYICSDLTKQDYELTLELQNKNMRKRVN